MKKFIKPTLLLAIVSVLSLTCTSSTFAISSYATDLAKAVIRGQNMATLGFDMRGDIPVIARTNPDNPNQVDSGEGVWGNSLYQCSKQDFLDALIEFTNEDIANVKSYGSINEITVFDEPDNRACTKCPGRALERAKGTFYQDYVYDYWKQYTEAYVIDTGHHIPSVEAFFNAESIALTTVEPTPVPTPTPAPTTPPKAIEKLNDIKRDTNLENTLYVFDTNGVLTLAVNGKIIEFPDTQPFITQGRTMIPIRALSESFNCTVDWDGRISTAIISGNDKLITIAVGDNVMTVNGVDTTMDTTAMLKDDRTCVPIRYIAEALGLEVKYVKV